MPHGEINLPSQLRSRANTIKSAKSTPGTPGVGGDSTGLVGATSKLSVDDGEARSKSVPEVRTVPGGPEGDLVFDHPPNQEEKEIAQKILEAEKK